MKNLIKVISIILFAIMFTGCGASNLSSDFSKDKLKSSAEIVIDNLNNKKYDDIIKTGSADLKGKLTAEQLKEVWSNINDKLGNFDSISKEEFTGKGDNAIVIIIAKYEKGNIQFTISYNKNMEMTGINIK
ncbi:hypothetical protein CCS79_17270 [Clostridium diolis]|uniref:DUF3887 domain-containing protein n=1 Tax=Clostridium diolis TaxID=223919 RepID=UPI000B406EC3|nr:DUF3887 domain-containing protein [Clostridium diolis]OVE66729.1 hypothetical protein CCS79_17270 [Clostridium diolis]